MASATARDDLATPYNPDGFECQANSSDYAEYPSAATAPRAAASDSAVAGNTASDGKASIAILAQGTCDRTYCRVRPGDEVISTG